MLWCVVQTETSLHSLSYVLTYLLVASESVMSSPVICSCRDKVQSAREGDRESHRVRTCRSCAVGGGHLTAICSHRWAHRWAHITPSHITLCLPPLRACKRGCIGPCSVDILAMCNLKSVCQFQVTHPNVSVA